MMRQGFWLAAVIASTLSIPAMAQEEEEEKAPSAGGSMDSGMDPADSETADEGPYSPKSDDSDEKAAAAERRRAKAGIKYRDKKRQGPIDVQLSLIAAFGAAPQNGPNTTSGSNTGEAWDTTPEGTALMVQAGGGYHFNKELSLDLLVPWTTAELTLKGADDVSGAALGVPQLGLTYRVGLGRRTALPLRFAVGLPFGEGTNNLKLNPGRDSPTRKGIVNRIAQAGTGWRDRELYESKRLMLTPSARLEHEWGMFSLYAYEKVPFGIDVGDNVPRVVLVGDETQKLNKLSAYSVTGAGAEWEVLESAHLWVGAETWLAVAFSEATSLETTSKLPSPFQMVVEPRLGARFGAFAPSVGYIAPLADA